MAEQTPRFFIQVPSQSLKGYGLKSSDKMVFGTIYTMLNVNGKCFMSNKLIAEGIELKPGTVSKSINKLVKLGLLNTTMIYKKDSKQIEKRYITLGDTLSHYSQGGMVPQSDRVSDHSARGMVPQCEGNRLSNRLMNIYEDEEEAFKKYVSAFGNPSSFIKQKLIDLINKHGQDLFDYAIELAATGNAKSPYNFIKRLLDDWTKHKLTTLDAVKSYVEQFKESKAKKGNRGRKPVKEELPDWAKDDKIAQMTPKEREERNRRLAEEQNELSKDKNNNSSLDKNLEDSNKKIRSFRKNNEEPKKKPAKRKTTTLQEYLSKMGES